jgi:hypothetical protein
LAGGIIDDPRANAKGGAAGSPNACGLGGVLKDRSSVEGWEAQKAAVGGRPVAPPQGR